MSEYETENEDSGSNSYSNSSTPNKGSPLSPNEDGRRVRWGESDVVSDAGSLSNSFASNNSALKGSRGSSRRKVRKSSVVFEAEEKESFDAHDPEAEVVVSKRERRRSDEEKQLRELERLQQDGAESEATHTETMQKDYSEALTLSPRKFENSMSFGQNVNEEEYNTLSKSQREVEKVYEGYALHVQHKKPISKLELPLLPGQSKPTYVEEGSFMDEILKLNVTADELVTLGDNLVDADHALRTAHKRLKENTPLDEKAEQMKKCLLSLTLNNLAKLECLQENYQKAMLYAEAGLRLEKTLGLRSIVTLLNLSMTFFGAKEYKRAVNYASSACEELQNTDVEAQRTLLPITRYQLIQSRCEFFMNHEAAKLLTPEEVHKEAENLMQQFDSVIKASSDRAGDDSDQTTFIIKAQRELRNEFVKLNLLKKRSAGMHKRASTVKRTNTMLYDQWGRKIKTDAEKQKEQQEKDEAEFEANKKNKLTAANLEISSPVAKRAPISTRYVTYANSKASVRSGSTSRTKTTNKTAQTTSKTARTERSTSGTVPRSVKSMASMKSAASKQSGLSKAQSVYSMPCASIYNNSNRAAIRKLEQSRSMSSSGKRRRFKTWQAKQEKKTPGKLPPLIASNPIKLQPFSPLLPAVTSRGFSSPSVVGGRFSRGSMRPPDPSDQRNVFGSPLHETRSATASVRSRPGSQSRSMSRSFRRVVPQQPFSVRKNRDRSFRGGGSPGRSGMRSGGSASSKSGIAPAGMSTSSSLPALFSSRGTVAQPGVPGSPLTPREAKTPKKKRWKQKWEYPESLPPVKPQVKPQLSVATQERKKMNKEKKVPLKKMESQVVRSSGRTGAASMSPAPPAASRGGAHRRGSSEEREREREEEKERELEVLRTKKSMMLVDFFNEDPEDIQEEKRIKAEQKKKREEEQLALEKSARKAERKRLKKEAEEAYKDKPLPAGAQFDELQVNYYRPEVDNEAPQITFVHQNHYGLQTLFKAIEDKKKPVPYLSRVYRYLRVSEPLMPRYALDAGGIVAGGVLGDLASHKKRGSKLTRTEEAERERQREAAEQFAKDAVAAMHLSGRRSAPPSDDDETDPQILGEAANRDIMLKLAAERASRFSSKEYRMALMRRYYQKLIRYIPVRRLTKPKRRAAAQLFQLSRIEVLRVKFNKWLNFLKWRMQTGMDRVHRETRKLRQYRNVEGKSSKSRDTVLGKGKVVLKTDADDMKAREYMGPKPGKRTPSPPPLNFEDSARFDDAPPVDDVHSPHLKSNEPIKVKKNEKAANAIEAFAVPFEQCDGLLECVEQCLIPAISMTMTEWYELESDKIVYSHKKVGPQSLSGKQHTLIVGLSTYLRRVENFMSGSGSSKFNPHEVEELTPDDYATTTTKLRSVVRSVLKMLFTEVDLEIHVDLLGVIIQLTRGMLELGTIAREEELPTKAAQTASGHYLKELMRLPMFYLYPNELGNVFDAILTAPDFSELALGRTGDVDHKGHSLLLNENYEIPAAGSPELEKKQHSLLMRKCSFLSSILSHAEDDKINLSEYLRLRGTTALQRCLLSAVAEVIVSASAIDDWVNSEEDVVAVTKAGTKKASRLVLAFMMTLCSDARLKGTFELGIQMSLSAGTTTSGSTNAHNLFSLCCSLKNYVLVDAFMTGKVDRVASEFIAETLGPTRGTPLIQSVLVGSLPQVKLLLNYPRVVNTIEFAATSCGGTALEIAQKKLLEFQQKVEATKKSKNKSADTLKKERLDEMAVDTFPLIIKSLKSHGAGKRPETPISTRSNSVRSDSVASDELYGEGQDELMDLNLDADSPAPSMRSGASHQSQITPQPGEERLDPLSRSNIGSRDSGARPAIPRLVPRPPSSSKKSDYLRHVTPEVDRGEGAVSVTVQQRGQISAGDTSVASPIAEATIADMFGDDDDDWQPTITSTLPDASPPPAASPAAEGAAGETASAGAPTTFKANIDDLFGGDEDDDWTTAHVPEPTYSRIGKETPVENAAANIDDMFTNSSASEKSLAFSSDGDN